MAALSLTFLALCFSPAALALDSGDIVVASIKGEVHVTMSGAERTVHAGSVLEPPAAIRTGRDGAIELRQGTTSLSVGPETLLEFPALEKRGAPIDRIVQPRGNAFYNIGKRDGRKLRVETPYLVGVVKGTQFNVAAQDEATTISLFEGLLEVHATDDSDVVDLRAGEIASRKRGDKTISVIKMDGKTPTTAPRPSQGNENNGNDGGTNSTPGRNTPRPAPRGNGGSLNAGGSIIGTDVVAATVEAGVTADVKNGANVAAALDVRANSIDANVGTAIDVGAGNANVAVTAGANLATVSVDAGASLAVGAGTVDAAATVAVDTPVAAVDAGADVSTDLGASGASVAAAVDAAVTTGAGAPLVDTTVATGVDLAADAASVSVDTGASVAGVDAGVAAATDVTAGTVDVGASLAGLDVDLGVDLGLDAADATPDLGTTTTTVTDTTTTTVLDVGGLLDSLVRRPGRK